MTQRGCNIHFHTNNMFLEEKNHMKMRDVIIDLNKSIE